MTHMSNYVLSVASQGSKEWWDEEYRIFYRYFPMLDGVYVESEKETFWYRADGIGEAREIHMTDHVIYNRREVKVG